MPFFVYLLALFACLRLSVPYRIESGEPLELIELQEPHRNGDTYVMATKEELLEKDYLLNDKNNQFYVEETRDSYFYDFDEVTWKHYRMDKGITSRTYISVPITKCLDAKAAPSTGSIGGQYKIGLTNALDFNLALDLSIPNFIVGMSADIESAVSFTFSSAVSCTIPRGRYGQLIAYVQKGVTPGGKMANVEYVKDIGFEPTASYEQVPPIPVLLVKAPSVLCRVSVLGCAPKFGDE